MNKSTIILNALKTPPKFIIKTSPEKSKSKFAALANYESILQSLLRLKNQERRAENLQKELRIVKQCSQSKSYTKIMDRSMRSKSQADMTTDPTPRIIIKNKIKLTKRVSFRDDIDLKELITPTFGSA